MINTNANLIMTEMFYALEFFFICDINCRYQNLNKCTTFLHMETAVFISIFNRNLRIRLQPIFFISKLLCYKVLLIFTLLWHKVKCKHGKLNFNRVISRKFKMHRSLKIKIQQKMDFIGRNK